MKHFMIHYPGMIYAMDEHADTKRDALLNFKARWKLARMPNGYSIWEKAK